MFVRPSGSTVAQHFRGIIFVVALLAQLVATAAPLVLEETAQVSVPEPDYAFPLDLAIDGDWLIAAGVKYINVDPYTEEYSTWLYQRQSNGSWALVRKLHTFMFSGDGSEAPLKVAMQGGVAVIVKQGQSWIFQRAGSTWSNVPSPLQTDGLDVDVNGGTIVVTAGGCNWSSNAYRRGTNGAWALVRQTPPESDPAYICSTAPGSNGDIDVASNGTTIIVASVGDNAGASARIFEGPFGAAPTMTRLVSPDPSYLVGYQVAIENTSAIVSGGPQPSVRAYSRIAAGNWTHSGPLKRQDYLALQYASIFEVSGPLALLPYSLDPLHGPYTGSVSVFERNADGAYRYAARLLASDRAAYRYFANWGAEISGRRVVVVDGETRDIYIFELPSSLNAPPTLQDTFEDGNASDWTPTAGSSFTVSTAASRVYRQSSTVSNAASLWSGTSRANQSISADIKPTAFATTTGDKWFGLVARYSDANNYYYVTLRNNNTALLRRMVNGTFTTLASASLPVTLNRNYHVRLEAIGAQLRLFVDKQLIAAATDEALPQGLAGVMMYKTRADYDNVVVSANPRTTLVSHDFSSGNDSLWSWEESGPWSLEDGAYTQRDTASGARSITGVDTTDDQVVYSRMRRIGAAGTNNWFGLVTRYRDEGNYYYVTLRNNNTVSLRKLMNGAIVELDSAPLTITTDTWYRVRFDAIGTQLRVYINDVLKLEANDATHATGRYGPVMYRTAAQYDDLLAIEP